MVSLVALLISPTVSLAAVGDVLLDRGVRAKIERFGVGYPFAKVRSALREADLAVANLECPLTTAPFATNKHYKFKAPPSYIRVLKDGGLDAVNLANNHALDCGGPGLQETMDTISGTGVEWFGVHGMRPTRYLIRGLYVVFLGFSDFPHKQKTSPTISYASEEAIRVSARMFKQGGNLVVVSIHWGEELSQKVTARQEALARAAAEGGADLVLGHHPHVLQPVKVLRTGDRRTLVAYSLGNFVFDAPAGLQRQSTILRCVLGAAGLISADMLPVRIDAHRPVISGKAKAVNLDEVMR